MKCSVKLKVKMAAQPQAQPPQVQHQTGDDVAPINKFKMLVPILKESLSTLMKVAAQVFNQNAQGDNYVKGSDSVYQRFDKSLEEFYAIADQIELNLRLALECHHQNMDSAKYTPMSVQHTKPPEQPGQPPQPEQDRSMSYPQYLATVRTQITCAKEVHDALVECSKRVGSMVPMPPPTGLPQPQGVGPGSMGPPLAPPGPLGQIVTTSSSVTVPGATQ